MNRSLLGLSGLLVLLSACGDDVNVGGPRADGVHEQGDAQTNPPGLDAAAPEATANEVDSASSEAAEPMDPRIKAGTYARDNIPCTVDTDCCVVLDQCYEQALVVSAGDKDAVRSLLNGADMGRCSLCVLPLVQASCTQGKCTGTFVD